jgi:endonuclease/exonuclease/phosphatase family metal-dependent hydrolase
MLMVRIERMPMPRTIPSGRLACLAFLVGIVVAAYLLMTPTEATPSLAIHHLPSSTQPQPPAPQPRQAFTIATWNLQWFFDWDIGNNMTEVAKTHAAPSRRDWEWRLDATADAIARLRPTILCLQEIENRKVMYDLNQRLKDRHQLVYEVGFVQGRDVSTEQDVAILCDPSLRPRFQRALEPREFDRRSEKAVSKQLMLEFEWSDPAGPRHVSVINVHLLAGGQVGQELERCGQARYIKRWIRQEHRLGHDVILLGDMNTCFVKEASEHPLEILLGRDTPNDAQDDLIDLNEELKPEDRITFAGRKSELDHILVSPRLKSGPGLAYDKIANRRDVVIRGQAPDFRLRQADKRFWKVEAAERDLSDHYPLFATFRVK